MYLAEDVLKSFKKSNVCTIQHNKTNSLYYESNLFWINRRLKGAFRQRKTDVYLHIFLGNYILKRNLNKQWLLNLLQTISIPSWHLIQGCLTCINLKSLHSALILELIQWQVVIYVYLNAYQCISSFVSIQIHLMCLFVLITILNWVILNFRVTRWNGHSE